MKSEVVIDHSALILIDIGVFWREKIEISYHYIVHVWFHHSQLLSHCVHSFVLQAEGESSQTRLKKRTDHPAKDVLPLYIYIYIHIFTFVFTKTVKMSMLYNGIMILLHDISYHIMFSDPRFRQACHVPWPSWPRSFGKWVSHGESGNLSDVTTGRRGGE